MNFLLPSGIGDVMWALTKIRSVASGQPIDVVVSGNPGESINHRSIPFLKRFPFIRTAVVLNLPIHVDGSRLTDSGGRYRYVADGARGDFFYLIPNGVLESGRRLERWLPEYRIDYNAIDEFSWANTGKGSDIGMAISPFVAFYFGPEDGNCHMGHNRNWLWKTEDWLELARSFVAAGLKICLVGAEYDRSFYERYLREAMVGMPVVDTIGKLEIGETLALLKQSQFFVSYQCGLGIVGHYMGVKVAMWWRPEGDSIHPSIYVSFDEKMATCWTRPGLLWENDYMGLIYTRQTPSEIVAKMKRRKWL